jgi:hypothetical protein
VSFLFPFQLLLSTSSCVSPSYSCIPNNMYFSGKWTKIYLLN